MWEGGGTNRARGPVETYWTPPPPVSLLPPPPPSTRYQSQRQGIGVSGLELCPTPQLSWPFAQDGPGSAAALQTKEVRGTEEDQGSNKPQGVTSLQKWEGLHSRVHHDNEDNGKEKLATVTEPVLTAEGDDPFPKCPVSMECLMQNRHNPLSLRALSLTSYLSPFSNSHLKAQRNLSHSSDWKKGTFSYSHPLEWAQLLLLGH